MNSNNFELIGKVNFIDFKILNSGIHINKILLGIFLGKDKDGNKNYDSCNIIFFGETADLFADSIKKGDYVHISGRINLNKYTTKEGKDVKETQLIGNDFLKVGYDSSAKEFVASAW